MLNKKTLIPVIGAILVALGINLDQFGIDLNQLLGDGNAQGTSFQNNTGNKGNSGASNNSAVLNDVFKQNSGTVAGYQSGKKWSNTSPAINLHHVFEGEINRKDKPVGYHSRPGGKDPAGAKVVRIKDKPNRAGVYTATISIRDGDQWKEKFSSFFPDGLSQQQVVDAVLHAYRKSADKKRQPWQGPSGLGFDIQGYTMSRGDINTAFPVFRRDR